MYRGRFAPSPTGDLHAGSLFTALASWLCARQADGEWLVRMEDIDPPREVRGSARAIVMELQRLGMQSSGPVWYQSSCHAAYQHALDRLRDMGAAFPCWCSRGDLAHHGGIHRGGRCITPPDPARPPAWRLRAPDATVAFEDGLQGAQCQNLRDAVGDFVLRRADGLWAYQLACVVDDAAQGITHVVRGRDLLDSTPRQIHLQRLLGLPTPHYVHLPLVTDHNGHKLSKSNADRAIHTQPAEHVLRTALACLGLDAGAPRTRTVNQLLSFAIANFDCARLPRHDIVWPTPDTYVDH